MDGTMGADDYIIAQFTQINRSLDNINGAIRTTNNELGEVRGVQMSQWGALQDVKNQMRNITDHYDSCPAFIAVDALREHTGAIDIELERLRSKSPSKAPQPHHGIDWREVCTAGNVKIMLLIVLALLAVAAGVSIPIQLM